MIFSENNPQQLSRSDENICEGKDFLSGGKESNMIAGGIDNIRDACTTAGALAAQQGSCISCVEDKTKAVLATENETAAGTSYEYACKDKPNTCEEKAATLRRIAVPNNETKSLFATSAAACLAAAGSGGAGAPATLLAAIQAKNFELINTLGPSELAGGADGPAAMAALGELIKIRNEVANHTDATIKNQLSVVESEIANALESLKRNSVFKDAFDKHANVDALDQNKKLQIATALVTESASTIDQFISNLRARYLGESDGDVYPKSDILDGGLYVDFNARKVTGGGGSATPTLDNSTSGAVPGYTSPGSPGAYSPNLPTYSSGLRSVQSRQTAGNLPPATGTAAAAAGAGNNTNVSTSDLQRASFSAALDGGIGYLWPAKRWADSSLLFGGGMQFQGLLGSYNNSQDTGGEKNVNLFEWNFLMMKMGFVHQFGKGFGVEGLGHLGVGPEWVVSGPGFAIGKDFQGLETVDGDTVDQ